MKIKILQCLAGTNHVRNAGEIHEYEDIEAGRLIAAGIAEAVADETTAGGGQQDDAEGEPAKVSKKRK